MLLKCKSDFALFVTVIVLLVTRHMGCSYLLWPPPAAHTASVQLPPTQLPEIGKSIFILTRLPRPLLCLNTASMPRYLSVFFTFALILLPGKDCLCISSHLLLPTVGICLFKLSPILSGCPHPIRPFTLPKHISVSPTHRPPPGSFSLRHYFFPLSCATLPQGFILWPLCVIKASQRPEHLRYYLQVNIMNTKWKLVTAFYWCVYANVALFKRALGTQEIFRVQMERHSFWCRAIMVQQRTGSN